MNFLAIFRRNLTVCLTGYLAMANFAQDAGASQQKCNKELKSLPKWDFERHFSYKGVGDPAILEQAALWKDKAAKFLDKYKGNLSTLLCPSIVEYESLKQEFREIRMYADLKHHVCKNQPDIMKTCDFLDTHFDKLFAEYLIFFTVELAKLSTQAVDEQVHSKENAAYNCMHYMPYIERIQKLKPHVLSEEVERALTVRSSWSSDAPLVNYLDKLMSLSKYNFRGDEVTMEHVLRRLMDPDKETRRLAQKTLNTGLKSQRLNNFASIALNMVSGSWQIEMKERGYLNLRSQRNLSNNISDDVVDKLLDVVRTEGVVLSKRYYLLKKKILKSVQKLDTFTWADRVAPLGLEKTAREYTYDEAVKIVRNGYNKFSSKFAKLFDSIVSEGRIDVPNYEGKKDGAFCYGGTPKSGVFLLLNYTGAMRDVETLAHEAGHGCHYILSKKQGLLLQSAPLTLAETASIFGEMMVYRDLLDTAKTDEERLEMLMRKIDGIISSVVRQCSFDKFEELVHTSRAEGTIDDKDFDKYWLQVVREYYGEEGEVFDKYEDMDALWSYVPHFFHYPFYVYSYAFADLLVGSLYNEYLKQPHGFEDKFVALLEAGGSKNFTEALKPFGLDPSQRQFWVDALNGELGRLTDEAEAIAKRLNFID